MDAVIKKLEAELEKESKRNRRVELPFEIWSSDRCQELLLNKTIVFMGDSNSRSAYVDLITHLQQDHLSSVEDFKNPVSSSKANDTQLAVHELASNGSDFFQLRSYYHEKSNTRVLYYFVTRVFSESICEIFLEDLKNQKVDMVIANSTFYDIAPHHYGEDCKKTFETNVERFCDLVTKTAKIPLLWRGTLPLGEEAHGGFLSSKITVTDGKGDSKKIRGDVIEANRYVRRFCLENNHPFLDCHAYFEEFVEEQQPDGIHWTPYAHRILTCMSLTTMRRIWGLPPLPFVLDATLVENPVTEKILKRFVSENENVIDQNGWSVTCSYALDAIKSEITEDQSDEPKSKILKSLIYPDIQV